MELGSDNSTLQTALENWHMTEETQDLIRKLMDLLVTLNTETEQTTAHIERLIFQLKTIKNMINQLWDDHA